MLEYILIRVNILGADKFWYVIVSGLIGVFLCVTLILEHLFEI